MIIIHINSHAAHRKIVNTLVHAGKRLITTVGVEDLNIIDTPDALLITKRGASQQVREIVEILHARGATEHIEHLTVQRPWGSYTVLEGGPGFKIKRLDRILVLLSWRQTGILIRDAIHSIPIPDSLYLFTPLHWATLQSNGMYLSSVF